MAMLRTYLPEFLFAVLLSILLLISFTFRNYEPPRPAISASPRQRAEFLLEVESPEGRRLRWENGGQLQNSLPGKRSTGLTPTELVDLRQRLQSPKAESGSYKVRFYGAEGWREMPSGPGQPLFEHLRVLGYL